MAVKVYVNGRARSNVRTGRTASEFGKEGESQYVVVSRRGSRVVTPGYTLKDGDTLVVTNRGVGG
jgi:hypothetical protein